MYNSHFKLVIYKRSSQTVAYVLRNQHPLLKVPVDVFMRMFHDNMFLTAPVRNWLFDGIEDPVLDVANHFPDLPINIPYDRFGWFYEVGSCIYFRVGIGFG